MGMFDDLGKYLHLKWAKGTPMDAREQRQQDELKASGALPESTPTPVPGVGQVSFNSMMMPNPMQMANASHLTEPDMGAEVVQPDPYPSEDDSKDSMTQDLTPLGRGISLPGVSIKQPANSPIRLKKKKSNSYLA